MPPDMERMKYTYGILLTILMMLSGFSVKAQPVVVDEVVGVVGSRMILLSDIENQYLQFRLQGNVEGGRQMRCQILENLLFQKLLINQAALDSVEVTDAQVESEMDRKLRYFITQIGSQEKLEAYYNKTLVEIKEEFRELIRDQLIVETMQQNISADLTISPSEVRKFFNRIPADSIPLINAEVEMGQIVKKPPIRAEEKAAVRQRLSELRQRILNGESFTALAALYSEDPGSASKGGEIGLQSRGSLYPEYEAIAFALKKGEISDIVESEAGFHIIQQIERRGDMVNTRHILLIPKVSQEDLAKARTDLENVASLIRMDSLTFEKAAVKHSDDPGKNNGGMMVNPLTGTTRFETSQLDPSLFFVIDKMEEGEISAPVVMRTEEGRQAYRILYLKTRTAPHRANLKEDYSRIQEWALEDKRTRVIQEWINKKLENTYVHLSENYRDCNFSYRWTNETP